MSIIIDTGVFYAFYNRKDVHHLDSIYLVTHILEGRFGQPYTIDLVVSETYTLLRYRISFKTANAFLKALHQSNVEVIFLDREFYDNTIQILRKYEEKKLSFVDAAIIAASDAFEIDYLASYDEQAFSGLKTVIGRNYASTLPSEELERIKRMISQI